MVGRPAWTFITNHGAVLALIGRRSQITAREIAAQLGITERTVQRIIRDLADSGYIMRSRVGRVNRYEVDERRPLRRSDQPDVLVADLLHILNPKH